MIQHFKCHIPLAYESSPTFRGLAYRKPSVEHFPLFLQFPGCRCQGVLVFSPFAGSCESAYCALYLRRWSLAETPQHFISPTTTTYISRTYLFSPLFLSSLSLYSRRLFTIKCPPFHSRNISLPPFLPDTFLLPTIPPVILAKFFLA